VRVRELSCSCETGRKRVSLADLLREVMLPLPRLHISELIQNKKLRMTCLTCSPEMLYDDKDNVIINTVKK